LILEIKKGLCKVLKFLKVHVRFPW